MARINYEKWQNSKSIKKTKLVLLQHEIPFGNTSLEHQIRADSGKQYRPSTQSEQIFIA